MSVKVEEQWRYRKVRSETASRSAFAFKINNRVKEQAKTKMAYGYGNIIPYSSEVIFKITGGARSKKGIKNSLEYISKSWQEELIDSEGIKYKTKEEMDDAIRILQANVPVSVKYDPTKPEKLTHNIVFSPPKIASVKQEDALKAAIEAIKEKYPNNYFIAAYHDEKKNSHLHLVLNIHDNTGKKIDIKNKDFHEIRRNFCQKLVEYGYDVKASRKYENGKYNIEAPEYDELKRENRNIYQVKEFGNASYKLDKRNNKNSYLIYKTANDKDVTIWGKELLDELQNKDIRMGDHIKISKTGEVNVKVPVFDKDGQTIIDWRQAKRNCWKIEKANSNIEHQLTPTPNSELKIEIKLQNNKQKKVIKLDGLEQREKQLAHREKFEHEKKLELNLEYKREFEQKQKLEHEIKHKRKFSW